MNKNTFVLTHPFDKPIHRLIMLCILMDGSADGEGVRCIRDDRLTAFCCCTNAMLYQELCALRRAGHLDVRRFTTTGAGCTRAYLITGGGS